jgi:hypothetical protein
VCLGARGEGAAVGETRAGACTHGTSRVMLLLLIASKRARLHAPLGNLQERGRHGG